MNDRKIAVIADYGMGNLKSVKNACDFVGLHTMISEKAYDIENADAVILPGVGAFPDAVKRLNETGIAEVLIESAKVKPLLGICLGMQLLFAKGFENGETPGLCILRGDIFMIKNGRSPEKLKLPHIGWNALKFKKDSRLYFGIPDNSSVYFVHSYYADAEKDDITATVEYGDEITASVEKGMCFGVQFHPEKSGETGLKIMKNFKDIVIGQK